MFSCSRLRLVPIAAVLAAGALAFSACASGAGGGSGFVTDYRGEPKGVDAPPSSAGGAPFAVWLEDGDQLAITLYGSSSCPPVVDALDVSGDNSVDVSIKKYPADQACTMDYVPHTSVFRTPSALDRAKPVEVSADDLTFTLPPLDS